MPGLDGDSGLPCLAERQHRIALQFLRIAYRQHPHLPAGTLRQRRNQVTVTGVVAAPGQHRQHASLRPASAQRAPGRMGRALHQLEAGRAGGDQTCIDLAHLGGGKEGSGQGIGHRRKDHRLEYLAELYAPAH